MFIVLIANGVRILMTRMADFAKLGSRSKLNRLIIAPIAFQYCITYIIVPFYATWKLEGQTSDSHPFNVLEHGVYNDFNSNWFQDVGQNVYEIMKFNMYMPIITFFSGWIWRYFKRAWD